MRPCPRCHCLRIFCICLPASKKSKAAEKQPRHPTTAERDRIRYAPSTRLAEAKVVLTRREGTTLHELAEAMGVSIRTARRYVVALEAKGEPLAEEMIGHRRYWRIEWMQPSDLVRSACEALEVTTVAELARLVREALKARAKQAEREMAATA